MVKQRTLLCFALAIGMTMPMQGRPKPALAVQNKTNKNMMIEKIMDQQNKNVISDLYEKCLNKRNMNMLSDLISGNYTSVNGSKGPAAFEAPIAALIKSFPDIQWTIEDLVSGDNKVIAVWHWEGTHHENFQHIAAIGKKITNSGMAIFSFENGKVVESKVQTDRLGFLQALDQIPKDLNAIRNIAPHEDQVVFVDRFVIPALAFAEFNDRATLNRSYIRTLPGFVRDEAYEMKNGDDSIIFLTVAVWASDEALQNAKATVQKEHKRQDFDMPAFLRRLNITLSRENFKPAGF